jgi:hypothetical protein
VIPEPILQRDLLRRHASKAKRANGANYVTISLSVSLHEVSVRGNHYFPPADFFFLLANKTVPPAITCVAGS